MPKKGGKRKKRRTHVPVIEAEKAMAVPKSFVLPSPNVKLSRYYSNCYLITAPANHPLSTPLIISDRDRAVLDLMDDLRSVMRPYTAERLKMKRNNSIKDFVNIASTFGVTHLLILGQSKVHPSMRIACTPSGPTLSFQITKYSLGKVSYCCEACSNSNVKCC